MKNHKRIKLELNRIATQHHGILHPRDVVAAARPKTSPLHACFEWNNGKAAQQYRIWQARQLIRVVVEVRDETQKPTNVWVSLSKDRSKGKGYRLVTDVMSDEDLRAQMLEDALKELNFFRRKYQAIKELAGVFEAIDKLNHGR